MIFKTPIRRLFAILSGIGLAISVSIYGYSIANVALPWTRAVFWTAPDMKYSSEYSSEFGDFEGFPQCSGLICAWPKQKRMASKFAQELVRTRDKLASLSVGSCREIDYNFKPLKYSKEIVLGENPVRRLEAFYEKIEEIPSYNALGILNRYIDCYANCNCTVEDAEFNMTLSAWGTEKRLLYSGFYWKKIKPLVENSIGRLNCRYKLDYIFYISLALSLFSLGLFEPIFFRIRKSVSRIIRWVKSGG